MKEKRQLVQMRMNNKTLRLLDHLKDLMGTDTRSASIEFSIQLAEVIMKNYDEGGKLYIENGDIRTELKITNIKK